MTRDALPAQERLFVPVRANDQNEWLTPPGLIASLGEFDLDPAAPIRRQWPTAREHYTIADNGLVKPWAGRVWLNPPYGRFIVPFMKRLASHGRGTALVFARTDAAWFHESVFMSATGLCFIRSRVRFHLPSGARSTSSSGAASVLAAYGEDDAAQLWRSGIQGCYVRLER
jgi:DNA N-6-adenine-methyltransferase Dam